MAYTEFSTKKADYVLQLGNHVRENKQVDIFKGIDALVIETGYGRLAHYLNWGGPQYGAPIKYCKDNGVPIFGTDVPNTLGGFLRELFSAIPEILVYPIEICYGFNNKKVNRLLGKLCSSYSFALQTPIGEAINAVNARKIEEFVIGRVREITGKKKPKIGLIFGAGHMGLEQNLRSKRRRNITLWNYKCLNFKKYAGLDRKELNKVYEGRFNRGDWYFKEHSVNLFEVK